MKKGNAPVISRATVSTAKSKARRRLSLAVVPRARDGGYHSSAHQDGLAPARYLDRHAVRADTILPLERCEHLGLYDVTDDGAFGR